MLKNASVVIVAIALQWVLLVADVLEQGFREPPHVAKPHTWWHWMNGNITREGITKDLEAMARVGIGGAQIFNIAGSHGCDIPKGPIDYLSSEWLDLLKHAAEEAERLGLDLAIQNCAGWASSGGPWVSPAMASQILVHEEVTLEGGERMELPFPQPEIREGYYRDIAVLAYPTPPDDKARLPRWITAALYKTSRLLRQPSLREVSKRAAINPNKVLNISSRLREDGMLNWTAPAGQWTVVRIGHTCSGATNHPAPDSGRGLEINKLGPGGVEWHWEMGIQPILDHLGPLSGDVLKAILMDSYEGGFANWTSNMRREFEERRGYKMGPYLLALVGRVVGSAPESERFLWDFRRTVADLYADYYYTPFVEEARVRGLKTYIEPYRGPFESMRAGANVDIPMGEFWLKQVYVDSLKVASSLAHLHKRKIVAAESFTAGPDEARWQNSPKTLKKVGDNAWADGVNRFVFHRFAHQPWLDQYPGMTMGKYGSHIDRTNTWWEPGHAWMKYIARSQFLLQQGESVNDVLCFVGEAAPSVSRGRLHSLRQAGYDYDLCGTDMIYELEVDEGGIVARDGRRYKLLIMPDERFLTPELAEHIRVLIQEGAHVIGPRPLYTPSLRGYPESEDKVKAMGESVWDDCDGEHVKSALYGWGRVFHGYAPESVLAALKVQPSIVLPENHKLAWVHRRNTNLDVFFVSNQGSGVFDDVLSFYSKGMAPELWDAETGEMIDVADWIAKGDFIELPLRLEPEKSIFVVFHERTYDQQGPLYDELLAKPGADDAWAARPAYRNILRVWRNGPYPLRSTAARGPLQVTEVPDPINLNEPWEFEFEFKNAPSRKLVFDHLKSWTEHADEQIRYFSGTAIGRNIVYIPESYFAEDKELWLDLGRVEVIAELRINGENVGTLWHPPYRMEVSKFLTPGVNKIEVEVSNLWVNRLIGDEQHPDDALWENGYLLAWPGWLLNEEERPSTGRQTFTTWKHWGAKDPLLPSGLMGPVVLRPAQLIPLR